MKKRFLGLLSILSCGFLITSMAPSNDTCSFKITAGYIYTKDAATRYSGTVAIHMSGPGHEDTVKGVECVSGTIKQGSTTGYVLSYDNCTSGQTYTFYMTVTIVEEKEGQKIGYQFSSKDTVEKTVTTSSSGTVTVGFGNMGTLTQNPSNWINIGEVYTITYNANGGEGTVPTQEPVGSGSSFTVASGSSLTKSGYKFKCWNDGANDYYEGDNYSGVSNDVTLTAQWEDEKQPSINFNNNSIGGYYKDGSNKKQIVSFGTTVTGDDFNNITQYGIKIYLTPLCTGEPIFHKYSTDTSSLTSQSGRFYTILGDDEEITNDTPYYAKAYAVVSDKTVESTMMEATGDNITEYEI